MKKLRPFLLILFSSYSLFFSQQQEDIGWQTLYDSSFPMSHQNPQSNGRCAVAGPVTPNILWRYSGGWGIYNGPVIGRNDNLYYAEYSASIAPLYALKQDTSLIWSVYSANRAMARTGLTIDSDGIIYYGDNDGYFHALNSDGSFKWSFYSGGNYIDQNVIPIDLEGNLYFTNDQSNFYCLHNNGELKWMIKYDSGFSGSSAISEDGKTIYVAGADSNFYALNLNGDLKWKFSTTKRIDKAPMVDSDGNIYIIHSAENNVDRKPFLISLNNSGELRWKYAGGDSLLEINSPPTIDYDGNIYFTSLTSGLVSLDFFGNFRWNFPLDKLDDDHFDKVYQPLICDKEGNVYFGSTNGIAYYAISSEGVLKWKILLNGHQIDNTSALSSDGTLYFGTHGNGTTVSLWAIKDDPSSINNSSTIPDKFELKNYPNPFNPSTTIRFTIPIKSFISLKIFDALGREIEIVFEGEKSPGSYDINWSSINLSGGIYFAVLQSEHIFTTQKLVFLK